MGQLKQLANYGVPKLQNSTYTIQSFGEFLGSRPELVRDIIRNKPNHTFQFITDGIGRSYSKDTGGSMNEINSLVFTWRIETFNIPRIAFAEPCTSTGRNFTPFSIVLEEEYFHKNDTAALQDGTTLLFFKSDAEYLSPRRFRYMVQLVTNNSLQEVPSNLVQRGMTLQYRSNYYAEGSSHGNSKSHYSTAEHRGYLSRHRHSVSWTGDFASMYYEYTNKNKATGKEEKIILQTTKTEQRLIDEFFISRENNLVFSRSNHDAFGKCTLIDDKGAPIPMGDGIIAQMEKFCDKYIYNTFQTELFDEAINSIITRTNKYSKLDITIVCNHRGYSQIQKAIETKLQSFTADYSWFFAKDGEQRVKVGAEFTQYKYQTHTIRFTIDETLSRVYPNHGYMLFIDTSVDGDGKPNVATYTLKGREMITGNLKGMGGMNGRTSGDVASAVDGSSFHIIGYSGIAYFNPNSGFIMEENLVF